jgi:hypothetical protein
MTRAVIIVIDLLLWCLQGVIMLVLIVPLQRTAQALTWVSWKIIKHVYVLIVPLQRTAQALTWVSWKIIKHVYYYGIVLLRRRITGRPMWADVDLMLGIQPPASEIERLAKLASD